MKIQDVPFSVTDWSKIVPTEHKGETGTSFWLTFEVGNIRVRMIEYSPGYKADHWCGRGHVLVVLEGKLIIELKDGREFKLDSGISFQVADDDNNPHLAYTEIGAKVFIVD
jgi:quercetin dioxygenase-like cupin family protein